MQFDELFANSQPQTRTMGAWAHVFFDLNEAIEDLVYVVGFDSGTIVLDIDADLVVKVFYADRYAAPTAWCKFDCVVYQVGHGRH